MVNICRTARPAWWQKQRQYGYVGGDKKTRREDQSQTTLNDCTLTRFTITVSTTAHSNGVLTETEIQEEL